MVKRERSRRGQERMPAFLLRPLSAALEPLATLAPDLGWARNHAADTLWRRARRVVMGPPGTTRETAFPASARRASVLVEQEEARWSGE
jgi:hypothetical protein